MPFDKPPVSLPKPVTDLMARTIKRLRHLPVQPDPIVPSEYRRPYGVIMSAVRSDGQLLETAVSETLKSSPRLIVLRTPSIYIPAEVDQFVNSAAGKAAMLQSDLHYEHGKGRKVTPDTVVVDEDREAIDFLELKRGRAKTDAGKTRQTERDLLCQRLVAKSFAKERLNIDVTTTTACVCAIHGCSAVSPDLQISLGELEERYGVNLLSVVERTYTEFGRQLSELLSEQAIEDDMAKLLAGLEIVDPNP